MKKLVVKMQFELEVPDDFVLREPGPEMGEMLCVDGQYLEPDLTWMALEKIAEDGSWQLTSPDEDLLDSVQGYIKMTSTDMYIFKMDKGKSS